MGVKHKVVFDKTERMAASLAELNGTRITVGPKGEHAWLAGIHEFGANIRPKGKYLTVPVIAEAVGRKARSFPDLFVYTANSGKKFLARQKGSSIECVYWLAESVTIPERAFIRGGHDQYIGEVLDEAELLINRMLDGNQTPEGVANGVGALLRDKIKVYATDLSSPPNVPLTTKNKGSSNPLVDTGDMINSIEYDIK